MAEPSSTAPPSKTAKAVRRHHIVDRTGPNWDENGDYLVGRGKPPKNHQWQKGQSGNPAGPKPREKVDPEKAMDDAILAEFMTTVNGDPVVTNLGLFAVNILKAKAAQKDRLAAVELLDRYYAALRARNSQQEGDGLLKEEQEIIDALLSTAGWEPLPAVRNRLSPDDEPETDDKPEADDQ